MLTDDSLHGRVVLSGDGLRIGEVAHVLLDPVRLRLQGLEVRVSKEVAERIGIAQSVFRRATIQIPTEQVQSIGDAIILSVPLDALRRHEVSEPAPQPA